MEITENKGYLGNSNLKRTGVRQNLTQEEVDEFIRCSEDPVYFIEKYVKIITLDKGFVNVSLYDFQREAIKSIKDNRRVILKTGRQLGKTTMVVGFIVWYIMFNEDKTVAILANKAATAREILGRVKIAYESLPTWLQQGIKVWNKGDIELENKCRVMATSTASSAIRGYAVNCLYLDEFAFVPTNIADEFFTSVYPTISSGQTSKILISSTPNGMNHFYKMWNDASENKNGFIALEANWRQVPGRDQKWADDQKAVLGEEKYLQEVECEFMGSVGTLISSTVLKNLTFKPSLGNSNIVGLSILENPIEKHNYIMTVDTSRGKSLDYSAFVVIDTTSIPYKVVCKYKNNEISPIAYPSIIAKIGRYYHNAHVLVELNDNGQQISDMLFDDHEYENLLTTVSSNKKTILSWNVANKSARGIMTSRTVKRIGCNLLKNLIERNKLIPNDYDIIFELSTFINKGNSYEADEGYHDDLVMCLVLFSWITNQQFFSDMNNIDIREKLYRDQLNQIEENLLPLPISSNEYDESRIVEDGVVWDVVKTDLYK